MSVSLTWRLPAGGKRLSGGSSDRDALEETFGAFPIHLQDKHRHTLLAMASVSSIGVGPYKTLADTLLDHEEIIVEETY